MPKKDKKQSLDASIPVRVTQAKNVSRRDAEDVKGELEKPIQKQKKGSPSSDLERLLSFDGKKRDMSKLDQGNPRRRLIVRILLIVLGLFAITAAGFLYFTRDNQEFGQNISFAIVAPNIASSGEAVTLQVRYENKERIDLRNAELAMQFPDGFTFQSSIPANTAPNTWSLGTLDAQAGGVIEIKGRLVGDIGQEKNFSGTLTYTPSNFNYVFKEETDFVITIASSTLSLEIDAPLRVAPEKEFETKVTYKNTSKEALENIQIILEAPSDFTLASSDPEADKTAWFFESLGAGEEGLISIRGTLAGSPGDQHQFTMKIGFKDQQGVFKPQAEKSFLVLLIKAGLTLQITTDAEKNTAEWGDSLNYTISYTNDGDVPLEDVTIELELTDETNSGRNATFIDWDGITTLDGGSVQEGIIKWDKESVDGLASVKPQDAKTFSLTIPLIKDAPVVSDGDEEFHILGEARAKQSSDDTEISKSDVHEVKLATQTAITAEARFYSDSLEEIGSGPLPPVVGEETEFVIFWTITNTTNDVDSVEVTATLPTNVAWSGESSISAGEPLSYNPQTKTVTWKINRIPSGAGNLFPELAAQFRVTLTPTVDQIGSFALLLNVTDLTAHDTFTDESIEQEEEVLTTNLQGDPGAKGNGQVQAQPAVNSNTNS